MSRKNRQRQPFLATAIPSEEWLSHISEHAAALRVQHSELDHRSAMVASVISLLTEGDNGLSHARVGHLTSQIMMLVDANFTPVPDNPDVVTLKWARSTIQAYWYVNAQDWSPVNTRVNLMRALTHQDVPDGIPDSLRAALVSTANDLWPERHLGQYALEIIDTDRSTTKDMVIRLLDATIARLEPSAS